MTNTTIRENALVSLPAAPSDANAILAERLVDDLHLAEALGYQRPGDIRKLIGRHVAMLEVLGGLRHRGVNPDRKGGRPTTAYQLNQAQAAFLAAKSKTKLADNFTAFMAETFAMVQDGRLAARDAEAASDLQAAAERAAERQRKINAEERQARSDAFRIMRRGPSRKRRAIARH